MFFSCGFETRLVRCKRLRLTSTEHEENPFSGGARHHTVKLKV